MRQIFIRLSASVAFLFSSWGAIHADHISQHENMPESPIGENVIYKMQSSGFFTYDFGQNIMYGQSEQPSTVVYGDDGKAYIQNPISFNAFGTYIEGTEKDGVITCRLPQKLGTGYNSDWEEVDYYMNKMRFAGTLEDGTFEVVDEADNYVQYIKKR